MDVFLDLHVCKLFTQGRTEGGQRGQLPQALPLRGANPPFEGAQICLKSGANLHET